MNWRFSDWKEFSSDVQCSISSVTGLMNFWGHDSQYTQLTSCKSSGILNCPLKPALMSTRHSVSSDGTAPSGICSLRPYPCHLKLWESLPGTTNCVSAKASKPRKYPMRIKSYNCHSVASNYIVVLYVSWGNYSKIVSNWHGQLWLVYLELTL